MQLFLNTVLVSFGIFTGLVLCIIIVHETLQNYIKRESKRADQALADLKRARKLFTYIKNKYIKMEEDMKKINSNNSNNPNNKTSNQ